MSYCKYCGKKLEDGTSCDCQSSRPKTSFPQLSKSMIAIIAAAVVVVLIVVLASVSAGSSKVDPFKYIAVEFSGYNTMGSAEIWFDKDSLIETFIGEEPELSKEYVSWYESYEAYWNGIEMTCSKDSNLTNGETITITVTTSQDLANKIESGELTLVVEDLTEVEAVDALKDVDVSFFGVNGEATADITLLSDDATLELCALELSKCDELSSGEVVTVTVANAERLAEKYGLLISPTQKEFTVPKLDEYLTDPDLLSNEMIRDFINSYLADNHHEPQFGFHYSEPEYCAIYFAVGENEGYRIHKNVLMIFVNYDEYYGEDFYASCCAKLEFQNIIITADGEIELSYDMGVDCGNIGDLDDHLKELQENYSIVAVDTE